MNLSRISMRQWLARIIERIRFSPTSAIAVFRLSRRLPCRRHALGGFAMLGLSSHCRNVAQSRAAAHVDAVEPRVLLSGTAQDIDLGSYSLSNHEYAPVSIGMHQGMQVAELRETLVNAQENAPYLRHDRAPDQASLGIEVGPYDQYVGDSYMYSSYASHNGHYFPLETRAYGKTAVGGGSVSKTPLTLGGFTKPWAEAYDVEESFLKLGNIPGALPDIHSDDFSDDLHDFVPDQLSDLDEVIPISSTILTPAGHTLTVTGTYEIIRDYDDVTGDWEFDEIIDVTYTFTKSTTNWQEPSYWGTYGSYGSYGVYGAYWWGNYGSGYGSNGAFNLNRSSTIDGSGTFHYSFDSQGVSTGGTDIKISDYELTSQGSDRFEDVIRGGDTQTYTGSYYTAGSSATETVSVYGNYVRPSTSEVVIGEVIGTRNYFDHIDVAFTWVGSDWTSTYTEDGWQDRTVTINSGLTLNRDIDGTPIESDQTSEYLREFSDGSYTGSGSYDGGPTKVTTRTGSRVTDMWDQDTDYTFDHAGSFSRTETTIVGPNTTVNDATTTWDEEVRNDYDVSYTDTETYFANGERSLHTVQQGDQTSSFEIDWSRDRGSSTTGDYTRQWDEIRGMNNVVDPLTGLEVPEMYISIVSDIDKNVTSVYAADGSLISITGNDTNVGDVHYRRARSVDGDYFYDRTGITDGPLNSGTMDQEDFWDEKLLDEYVATFDHETIFNGDGTLNEVVVDGGEGNGFWHLRKQGDYRWDGAGNNWTNYIDDEYDNKYGDAWHYIVDADFNAHHNTDGSQISKVGYHDVTDNIGNGIADAAVPVYSGMVYTNLGTTPTRVRNTDSYYHYHLDYNYSYASSGSFSSSSGSSASSSGSTTLVIDYWRDREHRDSFVHDDDYEIEWDLVAGETRSEILSGSGLGDKYSRDEYKYDFDSSWSGYGSSGSETYDSHNKTTDDQNYTYGFSGTVTHQKPIGATGFTTSGSVTDNGTSAGTRIIDNSFDAVATMDGTTEWDEHGTFDETLTFNLGYGVTTTYAGSSTTQSGSATVNTTFVWSATYDDFLTPTSWSDGNSGSGSHSLMPNFDVLRAGRVRVIAWHVPLFEVGNEFRRYESWNAEAGIPDRDMLDPHPHHVGGSYSSYGSGYGPGPYGAYYYGYGYGYYGFGYWYGWASGYNFQ